MHIPTLALLAISAYSVSASPLAVPGPAPGSVPANASPAPFNPPQADATTSCSAFAGKCLAAFNSPGLEGTVNGIPITPATIPQHRVWDASNATSAVIAQGAACTATLTCDVGSLTEGELVHEDQARDWYFSAWYAAFPNPRAPFREPCVQEGTAYQYAFNKACNIKFTTPA